MVKCTLILAVRKRTVKMWQAIASKKLGLKALDGFVLASR